MIANQSFVPHFGLAALTCSQIRDLLSASGLRPSLACRLKWAFQAVHQGWGIEFRKEFSGYVFQMILSGVQTHMISHIWIFGTGAIISYDILAVVTCIGTSIRILSNGKKVRHENRSYSKVFVNAGRLGCSKHLPQNILKTLRTSTLKETTLCRYVLREI